MKIQINIVLCVLLLAGCGGRHISDVSRSQPDTCPLHGVPMSVELVPVELGVALVTDYDAVREHFFPFCGDFLETGRCLAIADHESASVRVCPQCYAAKIQWQEDMAYLCQGTTNVQVIIEKWSTEPESGHVRK